MYRPSYLLVTQNIRKPLQFYRHLASESRAKSPFDCLSGIANDLVVSRLPANICGSFWDRDDSGDWLSIYDCAGRARHRRLEIVLQPKRRLAPGKVHQVERSRHPDGVTGRLNVPGSGN
jgi:hypothetical protein